MMDFSSNKDDINFAKSLLGLGKLNKFNKSFDSLTGTNELYEMATAEKDDETNAWSYGWQKR